MMIAPLLLALAGPLSLDDALARARANPRLKAAAATVEQQQQRIGTARAGFYPTMNAQLGYSRATGNYSPQPGLNLRGTAVEPSNDNFPFYSAAINVNQTVWDFGRTRANVAAAQANVTAAEGDQGAALSDLAMAVRTAYFGALGAEALAKSAAEATANQARHVTQAQGLVELGRRPSYDVARARVDLGNARVAQLQAENAVKLARADLSYAIGEEVGGAVLSASDETDAEPSLDEALQAALASRPELARQDARIAAQQAQLEAARKAYYPTLGVTGQLNFRGAALPPVPNWQVGANLNVPILAGGADEARIAEQAAALESLQRAREALVLDFRLELEKVLAAITEARARLGAAADVIANAREALRLAEGRYEAGAGTILELGDAQTALTYAQAQEIDARFDLRVARARLRRALGAP